MSTNGFYSWNITHCNQNPETGNKKWFRKISRPILQTHNLYKYFRLHLSTYILQLKRFHLSEMYRKFKPSWSHYHWPHFQIMAGLISRDLTFPMLITHLPTTQSHSWGLRQWGDLSDVVCTISVRIGAVQKFRTEGFTKISSNWSNLWLSTMSCAPNKVIITLMWWL